MQRGIRSVLAMMGGLLLSAGPALAQGNPLDQRPDRTRNDTSIAIVPDAFAPVVTAFTLSPEALPYSGGPVVVTIQVTDNVGVEKAFSSRTLPDGTGSSASLQRVAGSPTNGTWKMTWTLPANATSAPLSYVIKAWALDAVGHVGRAAAAKTILVAQKPAAQELIRPR